ncbi:EXLDI protein [Nocardia goodfellowii]|uniref:EXLDI family protein n=1 Tax=Nocardia goodfellowii TaxID=882446 RepID=A0ABS4Q9M9_9NOCA|nr:EXLDI protein [Nocardia goodfellowii]MBP2188395.1 EXLDI family protein [Nocardia goodfellowii]
MPNKTIYVSDDDLPLFARAQELVGGNLSGAVTTALRRFIELEEGRQEGYEEVVLEVGHGGVRQVRFSGTLLGETRDWDESMQSHYRVYRSRKGKYVMHAHLADWTEYPAGGESGNWIKDLTNWRRVLGVGDPDWGEFKLVIVDSLEELKEHLPEKLYHRVADIAERPPIEELDI